MSRIGVLALQGGYAAHQRSLEALGHRVELVRDAEALDSLDGLVLPGGESSTQLKLIARFQLGGALHRFVDSGRPLLATCAGVILSARHVVAPPEQKSFGWLNITVSRNAWGRQVHSFEAHADEDPKLKLVFIRAPRIEPSSLGPEVQVVYRFNNEPVMVRQHNVWGATFHPELTSDLSVHQQVFGTA